MIYWDILGFEMIILHEENKIPYFFFPEPEQMIPEQYRVLIYRCNDTSVLAYVFCDLGLFCRNRFQRKCIKTISYQSSGMPNLTHLSSIKQGYPI